MADVLVCKDRWNGVKNETFDWHNPGGTDVYITSDGTPWPFTLPSPIKVDARTRKNCGLIDKTGEHHYKSNPCPTKGNPKTVIIS